MIIYNSNKQLTGISAQDLKILGFKDLASLQTEAADFADLFVKTPGHVHNFKHVHWIDFVLCAKSAQESKAIIHANSKNFKVNLEVKTFYLNDTPSSPAFEISLNNLRTLSQEEKTNIAGELQARVAPEAAIAPVITPIIESNNDDSDESIEISFDETDEIQIESNPIEIVDDPYASDDEEIDIYEPTDDEMAHIGDAEVDETELQIEENNNNEENEFIFDPQKTAEALEMPVSLIEEFIEDFISQAKEFKDALYGAVTNDDMIELQAYSHKLKGVAANLRVHDALEILTKINKAKDFTTSKKDLDTFYNIISKLAGEKTQPRKINIEEDELLEIVVDDEPLEIIEDDLDLETVEVEETPKEDEESDELIISDDFDMLDDAMNDLIEKDDNKSEVQTAKYDKKITADEIGIDDNSFNELFDEYLSESQNLISVIDDAIFNNQPELWRESAIKLKGMSDNMRIDSFKTDLKVLITTKNPNDAKDALSQIQTTIFNILETKD